MKIGLLLGLAVLLAACGDSSGTGGGGAGGSDAGGNGTGGNGTGGGADGGGGATQGGGGGGGGVSAVQCADICPAVVAAACPAGPPTLEDCVNGCEEILASPCVPEFDEVYACAGDSVAYVCNDGGSPIVDGCEAEQTALYDCLGQNP